jgi:hypothetical protein
MVGDEAMASLKVAVMVIWSPGFVVLSESLVVIVTVGVEESNVKVML